MGESRRKDGVAGGGREGPWEGKRRGKEEGMEGRMKSGG